jgi:hypothetical protein
MRLWILFPLLLALAGCVDYVAERRAQLAPLIGRGEAELVQTLGVPTRTYETGGAKFLAYEERRIDFAPSFGPYPYGPPFGFNHPQVLNLVCETTFSVSRGVVTTYILRGNACG